MWKGEDGRLSVGCFGLFLVHFFVVHIVAIVHASSRYPAFSFPDWFSFRQRDEYTCRSRVGKESTLIRQEIRYTKCFVIALCATCC